MTRRRSSTSATPRPKSGVDGNGTAASAPPGVDARRRERAYQTLRDGIVRGVYGPNQRLPEMDLAAELGVSRQTVGIALVRLEQEGLVATQPNRGATVRSVSVAEALRILRVREALEGVSASLAAQFITADELRELAAVIDQMTALSSIDDLVAYSDLNARFHELILRAARDATLERMLASLNHTLVRYQYRTIMLPGRVEESIAEHKHILAALGARDPAAAEQSSRRHLARIREVLAHNARLFS